MSLSHNHIISYHKCCSCCTLQLAD